MNLNRNLASSARLLFYLTPLVLAAGLLALSMTAGPPPAEAQGDGPTPTFTPFAWAPTPVPEVPAGDDDIVNIVLTGVDKRASWANFRTDTNIVLSVNRTAQTVSMLSIPRDTYVWVPGWNWDRINTAYWHGEDIDWPGGGPAMLAYTLEYNFGIVVDFYAQVDFNGFRSIVDTLGGIDVAVDCAISGYKIKSWDLDESLDENYDWVEVPVGIHNMDGDWALWFARWRYGSNDWERNRRQQQILRAIWAQAQQIDIIPRLPELWGEATTYVETDVKLSDALSLVPVAVALDATRIESHFLGPDRLMFGTTSSGASILLPRNYWAIREVVENMYSPPTQNRLVQDPPRIEIHNGTTNADWDRVAAERLAWDGLLPTAAGEADSTDYPHTVIFDYTGQTKGSPLPLLQEVLNVPDERVTVEPDPDREVDYLVILGASYNSCTYSAGDPVPTESESSAP
jgi:LCP family protein required for cell wall assembly